MIKYLYDNLGFYQATVDDEFYHANSTTVVPPEVSDDFQRPRWIDSAWDVQDCEFNLRSYLSSTDYVDNKIIEASILGGASDVIEEYRPILLKRKEARQRLSAIINSSEVN